MKEIHPFYGDEQPFENVHLWPLALPFFVIVFTVGTLLGYLFHAVF